MRRTNSWALCLLLSLLLLAGLFSTAAFAEESTSRNITMILDESSTHNVRAFDAGYTGNAYVSLRDLGLALNGTAKQFGVEIRESEIRLTRGGYFYQANGDGSRWNSPGNLYYPTVRRNAFYVDGRELRYYTMIAAVYTGVYDCWIQLADFALIMDTEMYFDAGGTLHMSSTRPFRFDMDELKENGFFSITNGALAADATTGEVFYAYNSDAAVPIASTTKLMSYLVVMDALTKGEIHWTDSVRIGSKPAALSRTVDFQIMMEEGQRTTIWDLICGMLLPSSNESAVALAEHLCGSEEAFVARMNAKAAELGMTTAEFHNSNGLPAFANSILNSKQQNRMSANDMLTLVRHILTVYPQITEITSLTHLDLETLDIDVPNSNPLLYNVEGTVGLKTGSTSRAGYCLVAAKPVQLADGEHMLVVIEFGAEAAGDRGQVCEILLRYAEQRANGMESSTAVQHGLPLTSEELVQAVVKAARQ